MANSEAQIIRHNEERLRIFGKLPKSEALNEEQDKGVFCVGLGLLFLVKYVNFEDIYY